MHVDGYASVVVPPTTHCVPGHPQDCKDEPDHQEDNSECPEDRDACNEPDDEKDDPESYHAAPREWSSSTLMMSLSHAVRRPARVQTVCHDGSARLVQRRA